MSPNRIPLNEPGLDWDFLAPDWVFFRIGIGRGSPGLENPSGLPDWRSRIGSGLASTTQARNKIASELES